jgi:hypothetical protein
MVGMTPFQYGYFYDVPRCLSFRYRGRRFLLQSAFDDDLDEYPSEYSVYVVPESVDESQPVCSPAFLNTPMVCIGEISIDDVTFDPSKRTALDASCLDTLLSQTRA